MAKKFNVPVWPHAGKCSTQVATARLNLTMDFRWRWLV